MQWLYVDLWIQFHIEMLGINYIFHHKIFSLCSFLNVCSGKTVELNRKELTVKC